MLVPILDAIRDSPNELEPRLIAADWLEEHGQAEWSESIRTHCASQLAAPSEERRASLQQAANLLRTHEAEWLGEWRERLIDWTWDGGLLQSVRMDAEAFIEHGEALLSEHPVVRFQFVDHANQPLTAEAVMWLMACPAMAHVRQLDIVVEDTSVDCPLHFWLAGLANSKHINRLRHVGTQTPLATADALDAWRAFCSANHLQSIESLEIHRNSYEDYDTIIEEEDDDLQSWTQPSRVDPDRRLDCKALLEATFAKNLKSLVFSGLCSSTDIQQLGTATHLTRLEELHLAIGAESGSTLYAAAARLPALREFSVPSAQLAEYAASPLARQVTRLTVECSNDLDRDVSGDGAAWEQLVKNAPPPQKLTLDSHSPQPEGLRAIAESHWLRNVEELSILSDSQYGVFNTQDRQQVDRLARSGDLKNVRTLRIHELAADSTIEALLSTEFPRLETLKLTDDYHGRCRAELLESWSQSFPNVRTCHGLTVRSNDGLSQIAKHVPLDAVDDLQISFVTFQGHAEVLDDKSVIQWLDNGLFSNVRRLVLGFHQLPELANLVTEKLGDPHVTPHLHSARIYSLYSSVAEAAEPLQKRLGLRLTAR